MSLLLLEGDIPGNPCALHLAGYPAFNAGGAVAFRLRAMALVAASEGDWVEVDRILAFAIFTANFDPDAAAAAAWISSFVFRSSWSAP